MALKTLRFVAIVCASLALGLTVAHVLERPGKAQLSGAEWLAEVLGLAGSLGALPLLRGRRPAMALTLFGAAGFAGMLFRYILGNGPINDLVGVWTPATLPPEWTVARDRWDDAHTLSAAFGCLALASLLIGVLREAPGAPGGAVVVSPTGPDDRRPARA